jgi:hypothetical protein
MATGAPWQDGHPMEQTPDDATLSLARDERMRRLRELLARVQA